MIWRILYVICFSAPIVGIYGVLLFDAWREGKLINFLILLLAVVSVCLWVWLCFWLGKKAGQEKEQG